MIERSSPLVRQTLFNLQQAEQSDLWGDSIRVTSRPIGYQSQKQGKAEEARDAYQAAADAGGLQSSAELKLKMDDLALPAVTAGEAPDA